MSESIEQIISNFLAQPENIRQKYLLENDNDVQKAAAAFYYQNQTKKFNTFYAGGSQSAVAVMGHDGVDIPEAKPAPKPVNHFAGVGHSIGGPAHQPPPTAQKNIQPKRTDFTTPGQPKTKIRFTLPDGSILTLSVNLSATVGDLRNYIIENRPDAQGRNIQLSLNPGNVLLSDDSLTVEAGKLKMASVACNY